MKREVVFVAETQDWALVQVLDSQGHVTELARSDSRKLMLLLLSALEAQERHLRATWPVE